MTITFIEDHHIQFIMGHPTVTRLSLTHFRPDRPSEFWDALLGFHNLRALWMPSAEIFGANFDKFWQLCARLERLDISMDDESDLNVIFPQGELQSLKHLGLKTLGVRKVALLMDFLQRCPSLTSFRWQALRYKGPEFLTRLSVLLEAKQIPCLEHLEVGRARRGVTSEDIVRALQSMPRITTLRISQSACNIDFATLLQPHFSNLRVLELVLTNGVTSRVAQDILSSCPLLEKLIAPHVEADVVTEGKPWVCLGLKVLGLTFRFDPPSTVSALQPLVFDQLSKLTQLEEWRIVGSTSFPATTDLRIKSGLDKLSTLRRLHTVTIHNIVEKMGDEDVDWLLEHWRCLEVFRGRLNNDDTVGRPLREKLQRHGIKEY